jgi:signal transduction histidine kinase
MATDHLDEPRLRRLIEVGRELVSELDLEALLGRVLEAARELTDARYAALGILDHDHRELERFITLGVDAETEARIGDLPRGRGVLGLLIEDPRPLRIADVAQHARSFGFPEGHPPMTTFLGVPISIRGAAFGNLYLTEKRGGEFTAGDEQSATVLASWAAIAIENARSMADERLRENVRASDRERGRWARELHDETLQGLGALRLALSSALRRTGEPEQISELLREAVAQLGEEIDNLRSLITELRPAALDEIGLAAAIRGLADRSSIRAGLSVDCVVDVDEAELDGELESTVYRIIQEALTNVERHARAENVRIVVRLRDGSVELTVVDDGVGFDPDRDPNGFGMRGMRERVALIGGSIEIAAAPGSGTMIEAVVPLPER